MVAAQRESNEKSPELRHARRQLAYLLNGAQASDSARAVPAWQAWLFTVWCLFVCVAYAWSLFRAFR